MNLKEISKVVIVGGGTAGWIAACHIAKKLNPNENDNISITLLDSPDIPTIGVGEGTVPVIKDTLKYFGIKESDFIGQCDVTFKHSIKFVNWCHNPSAVEEDFYHHLFDFPNIRPFDVTPHWLLNKELASKKYADLVSVQSYICEKALPPKRLSDKEFSGLFNYAYHLDAGKFTELLRQHAIHKLGVKNLKCNVTKANLNEEHFIESLELDNGERVKGDFFVDCSGFQSLLIEQSLGGKFIDKGSELLADTALAVQVDYDTPNATIKPYTTSTAQKYGWIWDIGLTTRRGIGYVYSSKYQTEESARSTLLNYIEDSKMLSQVRKLPMKVGYQQTPWINNCVAMGLSQGFVEPLEATGLLMFDVTARMFAEAFPRDVENIKLRQKRFNEDVTQMWESTTDFIKLHYYLSKRDDSAFWIDNRNENSLSNELKEKLQLWRAKIPSQFDFRSNLDLFRVSNYLYVLYGMNYYTHLSIQPPSGEASALSKLLEDIQKGVSYCSNNLRGHRETLEHIKRSVVHVGQK
ncbi:tryptophan 7-halogenase [Pseudoalteromonas sp. CO342X]|uniref:Tryptophan 7-halogenase n=1 Tax=Pseudoalteromonas maricaloris TaxID=184924 RepID=A0A8I2KJY9_9GAMM|nr:tryptophan 7-halogenase [Pseudoalteromonas maricaloris]RZG15422.1 tryptophan 7-halogenase [Pseudoalteromonas sp. CO342X]